MHQGVDEGIHSGQPLNPADSGAPAVAYCDVLAQKPVDEAQRGINKSVTRIAELPGIDDLGLINSGEITRLLVGVRKIHKPILSERRMFPTLATCRLWERTRTLGA